MYGIDTVDRLHAKKIAGKIVPAIATTTSAVSGLVRHVCFPCLPLIVWWEKDVEKIKSFVSLSLSLLFDFTP